MNLDSISATDADRSEYLTKILEIKGDGAGGAVIKVAGTKLHLHEQDIKPIILSILNAASEAP